LTSAKTCGRILALLCALIVPAHSQTGSPKTAAQLNAEINARIISTGQQKVTAFDFRQVLLDSVSSMGTFPLGINQTTPATGTVAGPVLLNTITVIDQGQTVTGSGIDSFGQINNQINAIRLNHRVAGGGGNHGGLSVATDIAGANAGTYAGAIGTYQNINAPSQFSWGLIGYATIGASGHAGTVIGIESEMLVGNGGSAVNRIGVGINSQGQGFGSGIDAAIVVSLLQNGNPPWDGAPAPFNNFAYFSNNLYAANAQPIAHAGSIFASDAMAINNFVDFSNVTILGYILSFPNLRIPGNTAGFVLPAPAQPGALQFGAQSTLGSTIENDAFTGVARFTGRRANTSSVAPSALQSGNAAVGFIGYGHNGAAYNEIGSMGIFAAQDFTSLNNGSFINFTTIPLNSTVESEVVRIQQGLMAGTTTDPGFGKIDAANGYKSGGVAGVSCAVTTPAHITVVNGIVTVCN
jgi:hypothetical protein